MKNSRPMKIILLTVALIALATLIYLRGRKAKRYVISVDEKRCAGCGRCTMECRHQVLGMSTKASSDGRPCATVKHPEQCTACGHCTKVCRHNALCLERKEGE